MFWRREKTKTQRFKRGKITRHQWLMSVILATQEAEIRRIMVQTQLGK
jgi:hypothetical protein